MHVSRLEVRNFRRLVDAVVEMEDQETLFVGANNSGKTSVGQLVRAMLSERPHEALTWADFPVAVQRRLTSWDGTGDVPLEAISLDIWLRVEEDERHQVVELIPRLSWNEQEVGVRLSFEPKDVEALLEGYGAARAEASDAVGGSPAGEDDYVPWPRHLGDYLDRELHALYAVRGYVLESVAADQGLATKPREGCTARLYPRPVVDAVRRLDSGLATVHRLLRVDFLDAHRPLGDEPARRGQGLSAHLTKYYNAHLQKAGEDHAAVRARVEAARRLNDHYERVFQDLFADLASVGYPGPDNPELTLRTDIKSGALLPDAATVYYAMAGPEPTMSLPEQYNGLGYKNLIYMVVELLSRHETWRASPSRQPVHLIFVEEPEAHLHTQLQQSFVSQMRSILTSAPSVDEHFTTQLAIATHSAHVVGSVEFTAVRYFQRQLGRGHVSVVRNLMTFAGTEEGAALGFLRQYIKLAHCDLFFADAVILVEGNVERLLLPSMINLAAPDLKKSRLSILEVGGAFAYCFFDLMEFLGIPTLVITDLDSVGRQGTGKGPWMACPTSDDDAITANATLKRWLADGAGERLTIKDLLARTGDGLLHASTESSSETRPCRVRIETQTLVEVTVNDDTRWAAGRTLEEAIMLQNLGWLAEPDGDQEAGPKPGVIPVDQDGRDVLAVHGQIYAAVRNLDKTAFALRSLVALAEEGVEFAVPTYIADGLMWLASELRSLTSSRSPVSVPAGDLPIEAQR